MSQNASDRCNSPPQITKENVSNSVKILTDYSPEGDKFDIINTPMKVRSKHETDREKIVSDEINIERKQRQR